jgi:hypothetical protein
MDCPKISEKTVLLFGSGVSIWSPCDIPMGSQISSSILSFVFGQETICKFKAQALESYLSWIPFETINECAPESAKLAMIYANIFTAEEHNLLHKQLVELALSGRIAALITTNCDNAIELVCDSEQSLIFIYRPKPPESDKIPYLKVHGCATDPNSLVYKLSQEAVLEDWKKEYIYQLLDERELVVIGYSGIDFEICPVIASSNVAKVYWGHIPGADGVDYKTPGYNEIAQRHDIEPFQIDLKKGLPWFDKNADLQLTIQNNAIPSYFDITNEERMIWGFRLASTIGFSKLAVDFVKKAAKHKSNCITKKELGFPLFISGQFVDSARCFISKAYNHLRNKDLESCICSLLDTVESYRVGGYIFKALVILVITCLLSVLVKSPRVRTQANIKVVSMLKVVKTALNFDFNIHRLKDVRQKILPILLQILDYFAISRLNAAKKAAIQSKNMFDIKQVDELYSLFEPGREDTLSDVTSYRSLGYYSASTALFRKNKLKDNPSQEVINEAISRYRLMSFMENHQEAWKLAYRLKTITNGSEAAEWNKCAESHLKKCQYSFLYRKFMPLWIGRGAKVNISI